MGVTSLNSDDGLLLRFHLIRSSGTFPSRGRQLPQSPDGASSLEEGAFGLPLEGKLPPQRVMRWKPAIQTTFRLCCKPAIHARTARQTHVRRAGVFDSFIQVQFALPRLTNSLSADCKSKIGDMCGDFRAFRQKSFLTRANGREDGFAIRPVNECKPS